MVALSEELVSYWAMVVTLTEETLVWERCVEVIDERDLDNGEPSSVVTTAGITEAILDAAHVLLFGHIMVPESPDYGGTFSDA